MPFLYLYLQLLEVWLHHWSSSADWAPQSGQCSRISVGKTHKEWKKPVKYDQEFKKQVCICLSLGVSFVFCSKADINDMVSFKCNRECNSSNTVCRTKDKLVWLSLEGFWDALVHTLWSAALLRLLDVSSSTASSVPSPSPRERTKNIPLRLCGCTAKDLALPAMQLLAHHLLLRYASSPASLSWRTATLRFFMMGEP